MTGLPRHEMDGLPQVFLEAGGLHCSTVPAVIRTVLGSCVAVCLVGKNNAVSGMNHYVLPHNADGPPSLRYGNTANEQLFLKMRRLGCEIGDLRAKLFGGAAVLPFGNGEETVGTKNVSIALEWLQGLSIPIVARRTGGENGLLIHLYTATGKVMVRPILGAAGRVGGGRVPVHDTQFSHIAALSQFTDDAPNPPNSSRRNT